MISQVPYTPKNKVRIVSAAALFDGHDAAINIMRRIIQATGCEVIHLGHDRSVDEVVNTAIQEDANAIVCSQILWRFLFRFRDFHHKNQPIHIFGIVATILNVFFRDAQHLKRQLLTYRKFSSKIRYFD